MHYASNTPSAIGLMWLLSPKLALLRTLPDPPPDGKAIGQFGFGV
jgi:hypothetical protein